MRLRSVLLAAVLAAAGASAVTSTARAARKIAVGDAIVRGDTLLPYENSWSMQVTTKDGRKNPAAGIWRDRYEVLRINGKEYGVRIQEASFTRPSGDVAATNKTINVFERKTMAPVTRQFEMHRAGKPETRSLLTFSGRRIGLEQDEDGKVQRKRLSAARAFDFDGGLYALLWAALPLKEGFAAALPSYREDDHPERVFWTSMKVVGTQTVAAGKAGSRTCFIVEGDSEVGPLKYWISTQPPYIIRMEFDQSASGAHWVLTMT